MSYPKVSNDDGLNTTNNETEFSELRRVFDEDSYIKPQEGYVIEDLSFWVFQSPLGFNINKSDHIMKLENNDPQL